MDLNLIVECVGMQYKKENPSDNRKTSNRVMAIVNLTKISVPIQAVRRFSVLHKVYRRQYCESIILYALMYT